MYTKEQIEKIGNTIVFLSTEIKEISKTKLLKLLYILDEISIKKSGIPFLNLEYKAWKFGPVANDIFVELSSDPSILKDFITRENKDGRSYISPKQKFVDDEFTQNEIDLMNSVVDKFRNSNTSDLISYTHREKSPWYNIAVENSVYELLEAGEISTTEYIVNMKELVEHDERKKAIYEDYLETC